MNGDPQAAVRAAFESSYRALSPQAGRLFQLLGLVPVADFSVEAAIELAASTGAEPEQLLARLNAAHLIEQHEPGRYTLHDLLRIYARERAEAECSQAERSAAATRLYSWYLRHVDAAVDTFASGVVRLPRPAPGPHFANSADAAR